MKRVGVAIILFLAFCGLSDSVYLAQHEASATPLVCDIQGLTGCNVVATSQYSQLFGIPVAYYGILFYSILFVLAALELVLFDRFLRRALQIAAAVGILGSIYFTALQVFVIGAYCIYCLASALIEIMVFVLATLIEPLRTKQREPDMPPPLAPHLPMPPAA